MEIVLRDNPIVGKEVKKKLIYIESLVKKYIIQNQAGFIRRVQRAHERKEKGKAIKEDREFTKISVLPHKFQKLKIDEIGWDNLFSLKLPLEDLKEFIKANENITSKETYEAFLERFPKLKIFLYPLSHEIFRSKEWNWEEVLLDKEAVQSHSNLVAFDQSRFNTILKETSILNEAEIKELRSIADYMIAHSVPSLSTFIQRVTKAKQRVKRWIALPGDLELSRFRHGMFKRLKIAELGGSDYVFPKPSRPNYVAKAKAMEIVRAYGIKSYVAYKKAREDFKELKRDLPPNPWIEYEEDWVDLYEFFGTERLKELDPEEMIKFVQKHPLMLSERTYEQVRVSEGLQDQLPGGIHQYLAIRGLWPGWDVLSGFKLMSELELIELIIELKAKSPWDLEQKIRKEKKKGRVLKISTKPGDNMDLRKYGGLRELIKLIKTNKEQVLSEAIIHDGKRKELLRIIKEYKIVSHREYHNRHPMLLSEGNVLENIEDLRPFPLDLRGLFSETEMKEIALAMKTVKKEKEREAVRKSENEEGHLSLKAQKFIDIIKDHPEITDELVEYRLRHPFYYLEESDRPKIPVLENYSITLDQDFNSYELEVIHKAMEENKKKE